jgi:hypothetical protein
MQNPATPPKSERTCPTCSMPVEPGNKFCATCGTRIPELLTCSKCGTQFTAPIKYCDLCGAPVILGEVPEPDDSLEHSEEENTRPVEDQTSERDEGEIQEPDTDELPEDNDEENIVPAVNETPHHRKEEIPEPDTDESPEDNDEENIVPDEDGTPHHYKEEIQEPDTDELLEQFGKGYEEDETLESYHTPKPPSPIKNEAKKPVTVPAPPKRGSSETVDDALFLSPGKPGAPAKPRVNKVRIIGGGIVLVIILAAVFFIGLPLLTGNGGFIANSNPTAAEITPIPQPTIARTPTPAASRTLVPMPTQLVPTGQKFYFQVQKNPITSKISVIFTGSAGAGSISSADIKVTHKDGSVTTGIILPLKGMTEITLDGSKETDRVEIIVKMSSGETYRVKDELMT